MFIILQKLEVPERPLLGPNYKALQFWGLILPNKIWLKYFYLLLHFLVMLFTLTAWIEIWFLQSDMDLLLINLKVTMLATVTVYKTATFLYWQEKWMSINEYVTTSDLTQRRTEDYNKKQIIKGSTAYSRKLTYSYWFLYCAAYFVSIFQPTYKYLSSESYRENVKNGTESYMEVVSSWVPFDKRTIPGYLAASVFQIYASFIGGGVITSYDTSAVAIMIFFRVEFELLRKDCGEIFGDEVNALEHDIVMERFKDCHRRHNELVKYCRLFDSCLSSVNMLYTFVCSVMLCVTAYQVTIQTDVMQSVLVTVFLLFGVAQLFMYCWHSNEVYYASQDLSLGPYESTWYIQDVKYRKDLYILMAQFNKTIVFSVGPFTTLTVATFINILKGSYSYYKLITESN